MLRIDFYESGIGETTVITFPDGGLGIVDAHPSRYSHRPTIQQIVQDKQLHFVCLSHPHADHGKDLIPLLQSHPNIAAFWYSVSAIDSFIYELQEVNDFPVNSFPSAFRQAAVELKKGWAEFLIDLFGAAADREPLDRRQLHSRIRPITIAGVTITCLSPSEEMGRRFADEYKSRLAGYTHKLPDANLLSAILALQYGNTVILLGADGLKKNWTHAVKTHRADSLPNASLIKVPHHGANNAVFPCNRNEPTYFDIITRKPKAFAVLFAGDAKHPAPKIYKELRKRTDLHCLSNGVRWPTRETNPLGIHLPGARAAAVAGVCNPVVSFELDEQGCLRCLAGRNCDTCWATKEFARRPS